MVLQHVPETRTCGKNICNIVQILIGESAIGEGESERKKWKWDGLRQKKNRDGVIWGVERSVLQKKIIMKLPCLENNRRCHTVTCFCSFGASNIAVIQFPIKHTAHIQGQVVIQGQKAAALRPAPSPSNAYITLGAVASTTTTARCLSFGVQIRNVSWKKDRCSFRKDSDDKLSNGHQKTCTY